MVTSLEGGESHLLMNPGALCMEMFSEFFSRSSLIMRTNQLIRVNIGVIMRKREWKRRKKKRRYISKKKKWKMIFNLWMAFQTHQWILIFQMLLIFVRNNGRIRLLTNKKLTIMAISNGRSRRGSCTRCFPSKNQSKIAPGAILGTTRTYKVPGTQDNHSALKSQKTDKVDVTLAPEELEEIDDVLKAKYEQAREEEKLQNKAEYLRDMVAENAKKTKRKMQEKEGKSKKKKSNFKF